VLAFVSTAPIDEGSHRQGNGAGYDVWEQREDDGAAGAGVAEQCPGVDHASIATG
jgi:hypothetical protein